MFRIELSDRNFNRIEFLDDSYENLNWDFLAPGGCGAASFRLRRKYYQERNIAPDFNVKIYWRNPDTNVFDLWYQGLITNKKIDASPEQEVMDIPCYGYSEQLSRIYIDEDYSGQEVSVIVKDILDTHITPNTDITYDAGDITASSFTVGDLEFNTYAKDAIQTLADLVNYEWGVDKDRKFYFKPKSTTVGFRYVKGGKCTHFFDDYSSRDIVNRVIVRGGDVGGSPFSATYNHAASQLKWGRRDEAYQNSSIVNSTDAQQIADIIFDERAYVVRRGSAKVVEFDAPFEATLPINLFQLIAKATHYGEAKYGTVLYSGPVYHRINRIHYIVDKAGALTADLDLGYPKPTVGRTIAQIEHQLEQNRSEGL